MFAIVWESKPVGNLHGRVHLEIFQDLDKAKEKFKELKNSRLVKSVVLLQCLQAWDIEKEKPEEAIS